MFSNKNFVKLLPNEPVPPVTRTTLFFKEEKDIFLKFIIQNISILYEKLLFFIFFLYD